MVRRHPTHLWVLFGVLAGAILVLNAFILLKAPSPTGFVSAGSGQVLLCINSPPIIDLSDCSNLTFANTTYACVLNATDAQQTSFTYTVIRINGSSSIDAILNLTNGTLRFTPQNQHIGNYTFLITASDNSGCANSEAQEYFTITVNASSNAPYLLAPIPDKSWNANQQIIAFDLNNYFADPNGDVLAYSAHNNTNIGVSIAPSGEVTLISAQNWCGVEYVYFIATDPTNLTAASNSARFTVACVSTQQPSPSTSSGGGGGGGGGGISTDSSCAPAYACYEWSSCQLTRVVSPITGTSTQIEITGVIGSRIYTIPEEYTKDPDAYYTGFQYQECIDTERCEDSKVTVKVRPCTYEPSCSDYIKNRDETDIDCGGTFCKPCGTCSDGIQNGFEEGVDCGGSCTACNSCTNGKLDGQELGVDCGGPECTACATCFDGVQNQDEEGVDCGGRYCRSCSEKQFAAAVSTPWVTLILLSLVALVLVTLFFAALKRRFAALLMAFFLRHKKKNRVIIIPADLKKEIVQRLAELEGRLEQQPMLKSQEDLARIIRDYFKSALGLDFEFTYEELVVALEKNKLNALLSKILQQFFTRISVIEFSGAPVSTVVLKTLIQETRELVYQTAVLTIDDLKERERDLALREIPLTAPSLDRGYLLLSQVHLALQFNKVDIAAALYTVLQQWYSSASPEEQRAIYDDFMRLYDEYSFSAEQA